MAYGQGRSPLHGQGHQRQHRQGKGHKSGYLGKGLLGKMPGALKPLSTKKIRHRALSTMRAVYKPGFADLRGQEARINAVSAKRAEDNRKYLDWLSNQTETLRVHAQAADTQLKNQQQQIQDQAAQSFIDLRNQLVSQGGHVGTVTNPNQATANDVTPEAQRGIAQVASARAASANAMKSGKDMASVAASSNFALMAASDAKRQADQYNALKDVASARQKLILERAAKTAEEVARMLDQEIAKAQAKMDIRGQAGQLALGLKEHKLAKKQLALDRKVQLAQLKLQGKTLGETKRHNKATEHLTKRGQNKDTQQARISAGASSGTSKKAKRQQRKTVTAATKRYLRAHPYPKGKKNRRQALFYLQDRASHLEGVNNEHLANKVVARIVHQWLKKHRKQTGA